MSLPLVPCPLLPSRSPQQVLPPCPALPFSRPMVTASPATSFIPEDKVRFVCLSDTHGRTRHITFHVPAGDVLIHAGDFTMRGWAREGREFNNWLGQLPHKYKIVIAGNHDELLDSRLCSRPEDPHTLLSNATYLEDQHVTIYGIKIYGSPWIPEYGSPAFSLPRGRACLERWQNIPSDTDVLVTHVPPWGHGDLTRKGYSVGCKDLLEEVRDRVKPRVHVFGHIHEGYGQTRKGKTLFINASTCDTSYDPVNPSIVFDLDLPRGYTKTPRSGVEDVNLAAGLNQLAVRGVIGEEPNPTPASEPFRRTVCEASSEIASELSREAISTAETVREVVSRDRRTATFHMASVTGKSYGAVISVLKAELGLFTLEGSWVPKSLTVDQKKARLDSCRNLLSRSARRWKKFLSKIVVHGLFCEHHFDEEFEPQDTNMAAGGSPSPEAWGPGASLPGQRAISVFWDSEGLILLRRILKQEATDEEHFANQLLALKDVMENTRRQKIERGVLLLQDSANPTHTSQLAVATASKCHFKLVPIPVNSPDLYPSDYCILANFISLRSKITIEEDVMTQLCGLLEEDWSERYYGSGIYELRSRWRNCVDVKGDYFM